MPLLKSKTAEPQKLPADVVEKAEAPITHKREAPMTKDDYWRHREERDVQRDKDMAWSGIAQATIQSVCVAQLNTGNTVESLVDLVADITAKLLAKRDGK